MLAFGLLGLAAVLLVNTWRLLGRGLPSGLSCAGAFFSLAVEGVLVFRHLDELSRAPTAPVILLMTWVLCGAAMVTGFAIATRVGAMLGRRLHARGHAHASFQGTQLGQLFVMLLVVVFLALGTVMSALLLLLHVGWLMERSRS